MTVVTKATSGLLSITARRVSRWAAAAAATVEGALGTAAVAEAEKAGVACQAGNLAGPTSTTASHHRRHTAHGPPRLGRHSTHRCSCCTRSTYEYSHRACCASCACHVIRALLTMAARCACRAGAARGGGGGGGGGGAATAAGGLDCCPGARRAESSPTHERRKHQRG